MQALAYGPAVCGLWSFASSETHPLDTVPAVVCNINHTFNTTTPRHQIQIRCSCDGSSVETLACACLASSFLAVLCVETLTPKNARHPPFMSQFKLLTKEDVCVMCFVVATVRSYTAYPLSPFESSRPSGSVVDRIVVYPGHTTEPCCVAVCIPSYTQPNAFGFGTSSTLTSGA